MFKLGILYNDRGILDLVSKEVVDHHLCQDCIDQLEIQEFVDSPWDVEKGDGNGNCAGLAEQGG